MWSVAEWLRSWGWVCELFGFLSWPQLSSLSLTVTMRSSWWVWWRAWPPKQPLSCEIKGNGEKDFLWFSVSFVQNYFCGSAVAKKLPFLNPTPALPVREEEAKRRWRTTLRYRSVTISPEKNLSIPRNSLRAFFQIFLHPHISLSAQKHVTFTMGGNLMGIASKYNGNCLRMKNLELPDCHSATPYILPTSNRIVAKISNFLHFFGVWCKT